MLFFETLHYIMYGPRCGCDARCLRLTQWGFSITSLEKKFFVKLFSLLLLARGKICVNVTLPPFGLSSIHFAPLKKSNSEKCEEISEMSEHYEVLKFLYSNNFKFSNFREPTNFGEADSR